MNKKQIIDHLLEKVSSELAAAEAALDSSFSHKKDDDLKSEGKYDTRAIEAGYLVSGQRKRVEELKQEKQLLEDVEIYDYKEGNSIAIGALVKLKLNERSQWYFISSTSGGSMMQIDGESILVISAFSPIGAEVIGLQNGDSFELETPKETREYEILEVR